MRAIELNDEELEDVIYAMEYVIAGDTVEVVGQSKILYTERSKRLAHIKKRFYDIKYSKS